MVTCLFKAPQHRRDDDSDENKAEAMSGCSVELGALGSYRYVARNMVMFHFGASFTQAHS